MDFTVGGHEYRSRKLNAKQQLHIARRLATTPMHFLLSQTTEDQIPVAMEQAAAQSGLSPEELHRMAPTLLPLISLRALGDLTDADAEFVINTCLGALQRQSGTNGQQLWTPVMNQQSNVPQFADIDLKSMLELTVHVLRENLGDFFGDAPSSFPAPSSLAPQASTG